MKVDGYTIEPLTLDRWDDFVHVIGKGGRSGCWCMYWMTNNTEQWSKGAVGGVQAKNKTNMNKIVKLGEPAPGLLLYEGDFPIGWCRVTPRERLPGLSRSPFFKTDLAIKDVWSLSCFIILPEYRGQGLTTTLTKGAIKYVRKFKGKYLEVYPWKTKEMKVPRVIYTGKYSTFRRLGFKVVQEKAPHKPMMRLRLRRSGGKS